MLSSSQPKLLLLAILCLLLFFTRPGYTDQPTQKPFTPSTSIHKLHLATLSPNKLATKASTLTAISTELLSLQTDFHARLQAHHASQTAHMHSLNTTIHALLSTLKGSALDLNLIKRSLFSNISSGTHQLDIEKILSYLEQKIIDGQQIDFGAAIRGVRAVLGIAESIRVEMAVWEGYLDGVRGSVEGLCERLREYEGVVGGEDGEGDGGAEEKLVQGSRATGKPGKGL